MGRDKTIEGVELYSDDLLRVAVAVAVAGTQIRALAKLAVPPSALL